MPLNVESLKACRPGTEIHYWPTVDSTMREAQRLAEQGAASGTIVLADEQTAGVGRLGRTWHSEPEAGIYCSILLRLPLAPADLPIATLLLGLATAEAIQNATNLACDLRWPNDVLINGRKVAGILALLVKSYVVAGIGINVNHVSLPDGLRTPATSLRLETEGRLHSRENIVIALLESLHRFTELLAARGKESILQAFTIASSYVTHRRVVVDDSGTVGTTAGLDPSGFLLLRKDDGTTERIATGGVRPA